MSELTIDYYKLFAITLYLIIMSTIITLLSPFDKLELGLRGGCLLVQTTKISKSKALIDSLHLKKSPILKDTFASDL